MINDMVEVLEGLEPQKVFRYFGELTQIPRCSGHEKGVSDYLVNFAKVQGLEVIQDEALNVIIKKPGTVGYENSPTVILQGHMDMVCEKNKGTKHDFQKDPLTLRTEGDLLKATDTTLGADNGIAVAYCLAILASEDIEHPPLEVLITTEEETGMGGAQQINSNHLSGKILINIDSEEEGVFLVSCAGGIRSKVKLPIEREDIQGGLKSYVVKVRGLRGGHSGMEINKERGNSNIIMGRVLKDMAAHVDLYLATINGGAKMNAIPREADAQILMSEDDYDLLEKRMNYWNRTLRNELKVSDPDVEIIVEASTQTVTHVFSKEMTQRVISLLALIPNGIQSMSMDIEGLVESSTNLGVVTTTENEVIFESATRSSIESLKNNIVKRTEIAAKVVGGKFITEAPYPAWQYNPESFVRDVFVRVYKDRYHEEPEITAIHAGLECGLFKEKLGDIDMISLGPNMYDVHTPDESLSISSTKKIWEFLLDALKAIK